MTTSFRSKIKTVVDYTVEEVITDVINGVCCNTDGTKVESSFSGCYTNGGFFQLGNIEEIQCPEQGLTGCCCSCSYLDNFESIVNSSRYEDYIKFAPETEQGVRDNVTLCQCNSIGGRWFYGTCGSLPATENSGESADLTTLCGTNNWTTQTFNDVRSPKACCDETGTCTNVCTTTDCVARDGVQFGNKPCEFYSCSSGFQRTGQSSELNQNLSSCYELTIVNNQHTYTCSKKTEEECAQAKGYWVSFTETAPDCNTTSMYPPRRGSGGNFVLPPVVTESSLPTVGSAFQGGMYLGRYYPNSSTLKYRDDNNNIVTENSTNSGNGSKEKSWGIILAYDFYGELYRNKNKVTQKQGTMLEHNESYKSQLTSMYDGFYNTHGSNSYGGESSRLFRAIRTLKYMGFVDWYVPSIKELEFIFNNLSTTLINSNRNESKYQNILIPDFYRNFMSSTLFDMNDRYGVDTLNPVEQIVNGKGYIYGQNMNFTDNVNGGKRFVVDRKKRLTVPLVRRVYIQ